MDYCLRLHSSCAASRGAVPLPLLSAHSVSHARHAFISLSDSPTATVREGCHQIKCMHAES
eukprot:scaffold361547_cov20-Prasinocladus_malaysianus.AAC.1